MMKRDELDYIFKLLKSEFTKKQIRKKLDISTTCLSNRLRQLEDLGFIQRKGKYQIEILPSSSNHPRVTRIPISKKLNKRGHAFNFKVLFPSESNLKEKPLVKEFLIKDQKRKPKILSFGSISFIYKKNTIWINKESLTIYSNASYYSQDALHSKFRALKDIDTIVSYLKQKFGFQGLYGIEIFREHYGLIFNKFAEWLLDKGRKLDIKNKGNKSILWVDDSKEDDIGLKEFEGIDPLDINNADKKFFQEHERMNWELTPSKTLEMINQVTQNQTMFAENMNSHINAIKILGREVKGLSRTIKGLKRDKQNLQLELKNQKRISDFF